MNLIFDINNAFYKSYSVYQNIYKKDEKINEKLLFLKFLTDFYYSCRLFTNKYDVTRVICCYDSQDSFRKILYKDYKSNRTKSPESFYNVLNYSKQFLSEKGFIVSCLSEIEADDLCGLWVNHLKDEVNCILSADEDVRQLLNETTFIYNNNSKDKKFYYYSTVVESRSLEKSKTLFEDSNWILFKKMVLGCSGDMVPKLLLGRIGEKTLKKKVYDKIEFNKDHITNDVLVEVSDKLNKTFKDEEVLISELDANLALVNLCSDIYHSDSIRQLWADHVKDAKFTYSGSYQID